MANHKSYEQAEKNGGTDVWPGCGKLGRCMPCGRIHNFIYKSHVNGPMVDDFRCARNQQMGCPHPKPEPEHKHRGTDKRGRCLRCGHYVS